MSPSRVGALPPRGHDGVDPGDRRAPAPAPARSRTRSPTCARPPAGDHGRRGRHPRRRRGGPATRALCRCSPWASAPTGRRHRAGEPGAPVFTTLGACVWRRSATRHRPLSVNSFHRRLRWPTRSTRSPSATRASAHRMPGPPTLAQRPRGLPPAAAGGRRARRHRTSRRSCRCGSRPRGRTPRRRSCRMPRPWRPCATRRRVAPPRLGDPRREVTRARTPSSPQPRAASTTSAAGTAIAAISTGSSNSRTCARTGAPTMSPACGSAVGVLRAGEAADDEVVKHPAADRAALARAGDHDDREPLSTCPTAATAAMRSHSSKRRRPSRPRSVENVTSITLGSERTRNGWPDSRTRRSWVVPQQHQRAERVGRM